MSTNKFLLNNFLNNEHEVFHIARTTINSKNDLKLHNHNFAEVFWIKEGSGIHLINGEKESLSKGTLCMIRPNDSHTFKLDKNHKYLVITNIAFNTDSLRYYHQRYFSYESTCFWTKSNLPFSIQLDTNQINELSAIADRIISLPHNKLELDFIMIHIFRLVHILEVEQSQIPHWLAYAIENYNTPEKFKKGIRGFVELTERSVDHVNRVLKKKLKQTLTETVTKARLLYASQQLTMTNSSIKSICFECGFDSVSYFYRLFKKYSGCTPLEYQKKNLKMF